MAEKKKEEKKKRTKVCKVPVILQMEALECGAASLTMILAYYKKWIPLEQVREDCGVSRDGSKASNVLKAARTYGMKASAYRLEADDLKENIHLPCIIHWNFNHFVVLDGFKGNQVYLNDPAKGAYHLSMEDFERSFTGICMEIQPGPEFVPSGKPKSMLDFARKRLKGTQAALVFTVLMLIISNLTGVITPAFSRVFLDELLTGESPDWVMPFFIMLAVFDLLLLIVAFFQAIYQIRITGKMAAVGNSTYMWKVLHLPMNFFSQRMAGDIQGRQAANATIASTLINTFAPMAINAVMMVFYLVVMIRYSLLLTLIGVGGLVLNAVLIRYMSAKRVNITRVALRDQARLSAATVAAFEMIETIKSSGSENGFFTRWSGLQAQVNDQNVKNQKLNAYIGIIPEFLNTVSSSAILILGVWLTMQGKFTVGMIMAFQGLLTSFLAPAQTFITAGQTLQEMKADMERVEDVMEYRDDPAFAPDQGNYENGKLTGQVDIQHVTFGYSRLGEPVIKDFNLTLTPGKYVAIVGSSGCGKSTMSKLISGLYRPWSGEILFDGKPMNEIESGIFHSSIAVVDQDITLFEDTIANNIKMWDDSIEDFEMILAARDAQIHDDIMERPGGYSYKILDGGMDFSGGQRQRLEIARVLAQDPTIVILDEATSALDAKTEYEVVHSIRERGITCIVIAHRLSTIRSCDEIIVLQHGEIVDRGTHKELMQSSKIYQELVTSE